MRARQFAACVALTLAGAAAVAAEPLDIKPGLWETTTTTESSGLPPIDTSKMTPEQRARFEAAMKAREAQGPRTRVHRGCLTKERLAHQPFDDPDSKDMKCTVTLQSSSRTHWKGKSVCTGERTRVAEFDVQALSRERVRGTAKVDVGDARHAMHVRATLSSRWLSSDCGSVK